MTRGGRILVIGAMDTKASELAFVSDRIRDLGGEPALVDVSTSGREVAGADVTAATVAAAHPGDAAAVFAGPRGAAVVARAEVLRLWLRGQGAAAIGLGGSGGTPLNAPALRVPRRRPQADGLHRRFRRRRPACRPQRPDHGPVRHRHRRPEPRLPPPVAAAEADRPVRGLTMFGVTTRCVTAVAEPEDARRVFEACPDYHGVYGASSMERLPTERAILAQTGAFKEIRRPRPATSEEELINGKSLRQ